MKKEKVTLVIDRKKWGRGGVGQLSNSKGKNMCCLGFACRLAGMKVKDIAEEALPTKNLLSFFHFW